MTPEVYSGMYACAAYILEAMHLVSPVQISLAVVAIVVPIDCCNVITLTGVDGLQQLLNAFDLQ